MLFHLETKCGSVVRPDQAERVSRGIEKHSECVSCRSRGPCPYRDRRSLAFVQIIDLHVNVRLLRMLLSRPFGCAIVLNLLKRDDGSIVRSGHDLRPTRIIRYFVPTEQLGIEVGKPTRLRAVDHDHVECSDHRITVRRLSRPGKASGTGGSLFSTNGRFVLSRPLAERETPKRWHRNQHRIVTPNFRQLARTVAIAVRLADGLEPLDLDHWIG